MKRAILILLAAGLTGALSAQEATPRFGGSLSTGINVLWSDLPGSKLQAYAYDNSRTGWCAPLKADFYLDGNAQTWGYHFDLSTKFNQGTGTVQNAFQLWSAYGWTRTGPWTLSVGQLEEDGFHGLINYQGGLWRGKFGSFGAALKYAGDGVQALVSVPFYSPGLATNTPFRWAGSPGFKAGAATRVVGLDGTADSTLKSLFAAVRLTPVDGLELLAGGQGQGGTDKGYWNGVSLWSDLKVTAIPDIKAVLEAEAFNLGAADARGEPVAGTAWNLVGLVGWEGGRVAAEAKVGVAVLDSSSPDLYDLFVQPSVTVPVGPGLTALVAVRADNLAGKSTVANSSGKPAVWVNPELQAAIGHNQIAVGCYAGNNDNGGADNGFFGYGAAAPGLDSSGNGRPFVNAYATFVFWF